jgi:hypothetical protein
MEDIYGDEASNQSREEEMVLFFNTIEQLNSIIKKYETCIPLSLLEASNALSNSYGKYSYDYRLMEEKYDELDWPEHWSLINYKHFPEIMGKFNILEKEFRSEFNKTR